VTDLTVVSDDLASYLGEDVDDDRAQFFLDLVMDQAASIVTPVPVAAKAVVLRAAARGYQNPTGRTSELIGPYQFSGAGAGDVLLTKSDRSALRRLAGGTGAFTIDPLGIDGTSSETTDYPGNRFPTT
jgi:hypothetical protein